MPIVLLQKKIYLALCPPIKEKVEIRFEGKTIQNAQLLILKILNDGKIPIRSSDFEGPLKIHLGENTKLLGAEIVESNPQNLNPNLNLLPSKLKDIHDTHPNLSGSVGGLPHIVIEKMLLNPNWSFCIKMLLANFDKQVGLTAKIIGIDQVHNKTPGATKIDRIVDKILIICVAAALGSGIPLFIIPFLKLFNIFSKDQIYVIAMPFFIIFAIAAFVVVLLAIVAFVSVKLNRRYQSC